MSKQALIVIDVQNLLVDHNPYRKEAYLKTLNEVIALFRAHQLPVLFIRHISPDMQVGTEGFEVYRGLDVREEDKKFNKTYRSMFMDTGLEAYLKVQGITRLTLCGMVTQNCVDASIKSAFERGYELCIVKGGTSTFGDNILSQEQIQGHYENAWKYFGKVRSVEEIAKELN